MKQNHSLAKIKRFDILQSLKQSWFVPVLLLIVFIYVYPLNTISWYNSQVSSAALAGEEVKNYLYVFFSPYWAMGIFTTLICFFSSMICAVKSLSFLFSKKKSNVYLSFTLNRRQLYFNRALTCIGLLFIAVFIPLTINFIWNISVFGLSSALFSVYMLSLLAYLAFLLLGFGFGAFGAALAGNLTESVLVSLGASTLPFGVLYFISRSIHHFLYGYNGNIFAPMFSGFYDPSPLRFAFLTPTFFFTSYHNTEFGKTAMEDFSGKLLDSANSSPGIDYYLPVLVWLVISFLMLAFVGRLITRRKAENVGSLGANFAANAIIASSFSVWAVNLFFWANQNKALPASQNNYLNFVIILIIVLIIFLISQGILTRNKKAFIKNLKSLIPVFCLTLAVPTVMLTGGLGYTSYVPDAERIESASVQLPVAVPFLGDSKYYGEAFELIELDPSSIISPITSEKDMKQLILLHKELTKINKGEEDALPITIEYRLKDGKRISRCFTKPTESAWQALLEIGNSDAVHDYLKLILTGVGDESSYKMTEKEVREAEQDRKSLAYQKSLRLETYETQSSLLNYDSCYATLYSNNHQTAVDLKEELSKNEFQALKKSLLDDLTSLNYQDYYLNTKKPVAVLNFSNMIVNDENNYIKESGTEQVLSIYSEMKNTLAFLEQKGLLSKVNDSQIPKAAVASELVTPQNIGGLVNRYYHQYSVPYYQPFQNILIKRDVSKGIEASYNVDLKYNQVYDEIKGSIFTVRDYILDYYRGVFPKENLITDQEQLKTLSETAYPCYYLNQENGYYIWLEYEKETTVMFIPEKEAPDFIK